MALPAQIGRYRVTALLGRGAMGVVYQAVDDSLDRAVAVKVMSASAVADADAWTRFKREAQAVARLQHPNIVVIYELGEQEGLPFMALELLDGLDLQRAIESGLRPDPKVAIPIILQVLAGLTHAHEHGIVHRDLKPSNVFLPYRRAAKIMDFGLARLGQGASTTGVVGTPHYMSPEQARGAHLDARSDLFSAGLILYEVVTGEKAYVGDSLPSVLYKIVHEEPDIASLPSSGAWKGLRTVLQRALARSPEGRYPDAAMMASDLGQVLSDFGGAMNWAAAAALTAPHHPRPVEGTAPGAGPIDLGPPPSDEKDLPTLELVDDADDDDGAEAPGGMRIPVSWLLAGVGVFVALAVIVGIAVRPGVSPRPAAPAPPASAPPATVAVPPPPAAAAPARLSTTAAPNRPASSQPSSTSAVPAPTPPTTVPLAGSLDRANDALENRRYPQALAEARAVLKRDPGNSEAQTIAEEAEAALVIEDSLAKAKEALRRGDKAAAQEVLRRGLAINSNEARLLALWRQATE